jgi:excisionase family DNA binding protein
MSAHKEQRRGYSIDEAARLYDVPREQIRKAIHTTDPGQPRLRAKRIGRKFYVSAEALDEWFDGLPDA